MIWCAKINIVKSLHHRIQIVQAMIQIYIKSMVQIIHQPLRLTKFVQSFLIYFDEYAFEIAIMNSKYEFGRLKTHLSFANTKENLKIPSKPSMRMLMNWIKFGSCPLPTIYSSWNSLCFFPLFFLLELKFSLFQHITVYVGSMVLIALEKYAS